MASERGTQHANILNVVSSAPTLARAAHSATESPNQRSHLMRLLPLPRRGDGEVTAAARKAGEGVERSRKAAASHAPRLLPASGPHSGPAVSRNEHESARRIWFVTHTRATPLIAKVPRTDATRRTVASGTQKSRSVTSTKRHALPQANHLDMTVPPRKPRQQPPTSQPTLRGLAAPAPSAAGGTTARAKAARAKAKARAGAKVERTGHARCSLKPASAIGAKTVGFVPTPRTIRDDDSARTAGPRDWLAVLCWSSCFSFIWSKGWSGARVGTADCDHASTNDDPLAQPVGTPSRVLPHSSWGPKS